MRLKLFPLIAIILLSISPALAQEHLNSLKGKIICIDPGHGGTAGIDSYRVGPTGEREEWVNLRVGLALKQLLEKKGAEVIMTRERDVRVPLSERVGIAVEHQADIFVSIHHNATADSTVNFPIVYFHGNASENQAGVELGKLLIESLSKALYNNQNPASLVSDHVIFPGSGTAVLRGTYGIPGVLAEASFFTNPGEEKRLKDPDYNRREARAYLTALQLFFSKEERHSIYDKNSKVQVKPFQVLQEEERMKPIARKWKSNFFEGYQLYQKGDSLSLQKALEYFTQSARSFPDSWLARQAHDYRAKILGQVGKKDHQQEASKRVEEFYIPLPRNDKYLEALFQQ
ncbi:MAG TPA: N-acetylmuramoyl-L-alanine amidase [Balneolaceae bacterium]